MKTDDEIMKEFTETNSYNNEESYEMDKNEVDEWEKEDGEASE